MVPLETNPQKGTRRTHTCRCRTKNRVLGLEQRLERGFATDPPAGTGLSSASARLTGSVAELWANNRAQVCAILIGFISSAGVWRGYLFYDVFFFLPKASLMLGFCFRFSLKVPGSDTSCDDGDKKGFLFRCAADRACDALAGGTAVWGWLGARDWRGGRS